ncbi:MAG TPA: ABC-F family ATP-binding cassette domain-containing protein [Chitinophagaceae bacterium]|nr:ABC-F family ATP-binding cassette domain-containing protein [Chitinophagaceae bacterium]
MLYLKAENLSKTHADKALFKNISFTINQGDKIALVAANGTGKTSLLNILAQKDNAEEGKVHITKDVEIVYLQQQITFNENQSILDYLFDQEHPIIQTVKKYEDSLNFPDKYKVQELQEILNEMDKFQAWDFETKAKEVLTKLKIYNLDEKIAKLSGGQQKRVNLAKSLIHIDSTNNHYLLLLDEPTNHLDIEMIEWLEFYLQDAKLTLLLVSHDRYFIDEVCDTIFELNQQSLFIVRGDYEEYLNQKAIRYEKQQSDQEKAMNRFKTELEWMRKQPRARTTKSKKREERFYEWQKKAHNFQEDRKMELEMKMQRLGGKIVELIEVSKSYDNKVILDDFSYNFTAGEKVGIIGPNGVGKTTFLKIIQGIESIDKGKVDIGETISFGYFSQEGLQYNEDQRVIEYVKDLASVFPLKNGKFLSAGQFLEKFLFNTDKQYQYISKLSGGEKKRLHLLSVLFQNPNFLILDEPTNDLDLQTLEILEEFINEYQGCVLIISHDRYFMDRVVDHLFIFKGSGIIKDFPGNFSEYRTLEEIQEEKRKQEEKKIESKEKPIIKKNKKRLGFNEKRELKLLNEELPKLEILKKELEEKMQNANLDFEEMEKIGNNYKDILDQIDEKEMRWLELQELAE